MSRIAIPALVAMMAVAGLLGVAGWNASGEPLQVITLTERELALPHARPVPDEEPALQLLLQYQSRHDPVESRNWLPDSRLRELGFTLHVPAGAPQASHVYDHVPARLGWVVFEYDGPAWREMERRRDLQSEPIRSAAVPSRLVPVDAGADYERLRLRYPSGHLILRGVIGLSYVPGERGGPLVHGWLRELVPARVAVPSQFRGLLEAVREAGTAPGSGPRYEVDLVVGRLGLPVVAAVRLAGEAGN